MLLKKLKRFKNIKLKIIYIKYLKKDFIEDNFTFKIYDKKYTINNYENLFLNRNIKNLNDTIRFLEENFDLKNLILKIRLFNFENQYDKSYFNIGIEVYYVNMFLCNSTIVVNYQNIEKAKKIIAYKKLNNDLKLNNIVINKRVKI